MIDWTKSAQEIHNQVRSMTTWPVACTTINNKNVKILKTSVQDNDIINKNCGEIINISKEGIAVTAKKGILLIQELKPEGKAQMPAYNWTNGAKLQTGDKFK